MNRIPESCSRMEILRDWQIVDEIGAGGYGVVFHVRHEKTNEEAALKWIHIERDDTRGFDATTFLDAQTNLLNEISVMRKLSDTPEIVTIYDAACQTAPDGNAMDVLIRMELLNPLTAVLKNGEITVAQVKEIAAHVGRALCVCHERDIIHGDVKPENILCGKNHYKLSDFGVSLSRLLQGNAVARGTQYFQPPEYDREQTATRQGDIFSFAMMLYVLFNNGRLPFQTGFSAEEEQAARQEYRSLLHMPDGRVPGPQFAAAGISEVICRAISPYKEKRYRTVQEFLGAFNAAYALLSPAEASLHLPYCKSDAYLSEEVRMYLSTGRKTPRFDLNPTEAAQEPTVQETEPSSPVGFEIPPDVEKRKEDKPESEAQETPTEKKKRGKGKYVLILAVLLLAAGAVLAYIRFAPDAFQYKTEVFETHAVFTLESKKEASFSAELIPEGAAHEKILAQGANGVIRANGLVPETRYNVKLYADGALAQTNICTLAAAEGNFAPYAQKAYTAEAYIAEASTFAQMQLRNELQEVIDGELTLRNVTLKEQGKEIFVEFRVQTSLTRIQDASEMTVCVQTESGDIYTVVMEYAPMDIPDEVVRVHFNISDIFERIYQNTGKQASGKVIVRMYWLNESIGSIELKVKCEG